MIDKKKWERIPEKKWECLPYGCEHEFVFERFTWNPNDGRLWEVLQCSRCGLHSASWTLPDSAHEVMKKNAPSRD